MTLLQNALNERRRRIPINNNLTQEHLELAHAYAMGAVTLSQVARAINDSNSTSHTYIFLTKALAMIVRGETPPKKR